MDRRLEDGSWGETTSAETIRRQTRDYVQGNLQGSGISTTKSLPAPLSARASRLVSLMRTFAFPFIGVLARDIPPAIRRVTTAPRRFAAYVAYGLWWIYGAIPTGLALLGVRLLELIEPDRVAPPADEEAIRRLEDAEDLRPKNEVTLWFPVRPTWIRRLLMRLILFGSECGCRHFWTDGKLTDIETIHYARIMQVDDGHTMLFMSDYDGGLNRHLDDFIGIGGRGVIPISSSIDGCPKTRWLFWQSDPDTFGDRWKAMVRRYQLEVSFWYNAYPLITVQNVIDNSRLRNELFASVLTEREARRWTRRL